MNGNGDFLAMEPMMPDRDRPRHAWAEVLITYMPILRPMLAAKAEVLATLRFPILATPKIDGIRCLTIQPNVLFVKNQRCNPVSRNIKLIPNQHINSKMMVDLPPGLDGELVAMDGNKILKFNDTSSAIMSNMGFPEFRYIVFDCGHHEIFRTGKNAPYWERLEWLKQMDLPDYCVKLMPMRINSAPDLQAYESAMLLEGHEGVMIRTFDSPYKFGRSTLKEQWLVKIKRFQDNEAEVIGYDELMHNDNPQETSALGYAERSTHKANMIPAGKLGAFRVRDLKTNQEFNVGTGYDDHERRLFWTMRDTYIGTILKYKSQPFGEHEAPRFPVFIGWRHKNDL